MLKFFQKKIKKDSKLAVHFDENIVSIVCVSRKKGKPPRVKLCETHEAESVSTRDEILSQLIKKHNLNAYLCVNVMSFSEYNLLLIDMPDVEPEELKSAIRWRIKDQIDFDIEDAVIDVFDVPDQEAESGHNIGYVVIAKSSLAKQIIACLTKARLNLEVIDIPEFALRNITALLPEDADGVVTIHIDLDTTFINITRKGTLYLSRRMESGYRTLPETLSNVEDDEQCQRWLDRLVIEIQRSIDYYDSCFSQPHLSSVVVTSLEKNTPGLIEYLSAQLGFEVRQLNLDKLVDFVTPIPEEMHSRYLLPIGAALRKEDMTL